MATDEKTRDDLHGRINSFDQNLRSLERRLRAVERRLSLEIPPQNMIDDPAHIETDLLQQMHIELSELKEQMGSLDKKGSEDFGRGDINSLRQELAELQQQVRTLNEGYQQTKNELLNNKNDDHMLTLTQNMKDQLGGNGLGRTAKKLKV